MSVMYGYTIETFVDFIAGLTFFQVSSLSVTSEAIHGLSTHSYTQFKTVYCKETQSKFN